MLFDIPRILHVLLLLFDLFFLCHFFFSFLNELLHEVFDFVHPLIENIKAHLRLMSEAVTDSILYVFAFEIATIGHVVDRHARV